MAIARNWRPRGVETPVLAPLGPEGAGSKGAGPRRGGEGVRLSGCRRALATALRPAGTGPDTPARPGERQAEGCGRQALLAAAPAVHWIHALHLPHKALQHPHLTAAILLGLCLGVLTRVVLLRADAAPFPSKPHGRINFLFLGFVASALGVLAPAALLTANYTAGVFLAIGLSQFHTVRQIDRDMLLALDHAELVPRGRAYVEGLSMMTETRNYLVMLIAMLTSAGSLLFGPLVGAASGLVTAVLVTAAARSGAKVGNIARVEPAPVTHEGEHVRVAGVPVLTSPGQAALAALPEAIGVRVRPRDLAARIQLAQPGQRQAILHNVAAGLGIRAGGRGAEGGEAQPAGDQGGHIHPGGVAGLGVQEDKLKDAPSAEAPRASPLLPRCALDPRGGDLVLLVFPAVRAPALLLRTVRQTPRLETMEHRPLRGVSAESGD